MIKANILSQSYFTIKRTIFKRKLKIIIAINWFSWNLRNRKLVNAISKTLDDWNLFIINFPTRFPNLNRSNFLLHYKYWIYWVQKMDKRERIIYNKLNPFLILNDEDWVHLDLSKKETPILYYTFYFPTNEWKSVKLFDSLEDFETYLKNNENSEATLQQYLSSIVRSERLRFIKNKLESFDNLPPRILTENGGIRINPYYLKDKP